MSAERPPARVRLLRRPLDWTLAPERAALLVRGDTNPFALIGEWAGGGALIGSEPVRVAAEDDDPFALLDEQPVVEGAVTAAGGRAEGPPAGPEGPPAGPEGPPAGPEGPPAGPEGPPAEPEGSRGGPGGPPQGGPGASGAVGGGWFGVLGFQLAGRVEPVGAGPPRPVPLPAAALAFYDHLLHLDAAGHWWFEALVAPGREAAIEARYEALRERAADPPAPRPFTTAAWRPVPGAAGHAAAVAACRERIHAGDLFQANLCLRLESTLEGDPLDLFAAGVTALRPARAAYVAGPWGAVASLSPELFLARPGRGRRVRSAPIKGTRPRPADPGAAAAERAALAASEKDRAENVMIVDLVRNDLGRVCEPGSVEVEALCAVHAHTGVWHLVSEVAGTVRAGCGDADLVRAAFPPGSVTGAPKVAALGVIAELESTGREAYTGALGFASPLAGLELSVAIRTFEHRDGALWLGVGGGVVADSDPAAEAQEAATKAAPLLAAIGAGGFQTAATSGPRPLRLGPRPLPRPDPACGVFETVLASRGRAVAAERHLARLRASCLALYGAPPSPDAARMLDEAAAALGAGRIRLTVRPQGAGLVAEVERGPLPHATAAPRLRAVALPGGWGAHKWRDRRWLEALEAAVAPGETPLLVDLDGLVLETTRANVLAVEGRTLVTPPADGRILPGVTRARVLEQAHLATQEVPLALDRLVAADAVLLTGALRGVQAAVACDGGALRQPHPATVARLRDVLAEQPAPA